MTIEIKFTDLSETDALNLLTAVFNRGYVHSCAHQYSANDLKKAAKTLTESENTSVLSDMLGLFTFTDKYGNSNVVTQIDQLPCRFYPAFANLLKNMGCNIS